MTDKKKREIVTEEVGKIYDQLVINCKKTCGAGYSRWGEDLLAMCLEMFFEKKTDYIWKVYQDGKLENFITFVMAFQLKSNSSKFWHVYRKHLYSYRELYPNIPYANHVSYNQAFNDEPSDLYYCLKKAIDSLDPYQKMLVNEIMIGGKKFNKTSQKYNINYHSLKTDYKLVKALIQRKCQHLQ